MFHKMMALTTRLRPEARKAWLSKEPSRISPRSWKKTARVSLLPASPLFSPARQRSRSCRAGVPFDHEQGPLDPADFTQRARQRVRFRQGGELLQQGRRHNEPIHDRDAGAQRFIPALADCGGIDTVADVMLDRRVGICALEAVQAPILEIAQPRCDALSAQCKQAEDMVAGAAGVDVMLVDFDLALMSV